MGFYGYQPTRIFLIRHTVLPLTGGPFYRNDGFTEADLRGQITSLSTEEGVINMNRALIPAPVMASSAQRPGSQLAVLALWLDRTTRSSLSVNVPA